MKQFEKFIQEIEDVCKKYQISISHEDTHGAFILQPYSKEYMDWFKCAHVTKEII